MKRIYAYILLLVLLGGTSIWTYNRGDRRPNVTEHSDETAGTSHSDAEPSSEESAAAETRDEDVPVSPYGFGPYPPLPEGWPSSFWPRSSPWHELMARVEIKLISQGINVEGAIMENDLVFPTIGDTVYIRWDESNGERYISELAGDPDACERIRVIEEARGDGFTEADIPSDIKIIPYEEGGIDPYKFLDLPRR